MRQPGRRAAGRVTDLLTDLEPRKGETMTRLTINREAGQPAAPEIPDFPENRRGSPANCSTPANCSDNAQGEPMRVRHVASHIGELWIVELKSGATGKWIIQGEHLTEAAAYADLETWE